MKPCPPANRRAKPRPFALHAPFRLPGETSGSDMVDFVRLLREADEISLRLKTHAFARVKNGARRVFRILAAMLKNEIPIEKAGWRLRQIIPDANDRRENAKFFTRALRLNDSAKARARRRRDMARRGRLLQARRKLMEGFNALCEAAQAGDADATRNLVDHAELATMSLGLLEVVKPAAVRAVARQRDDWPVLISMTSDWEKQLKNRIARLELGAEVADVLCHFRRARGADGNYPARVWAKAAVETIHETQVRCLAYLGFRQLIEEMLSQGTWQMLTPPAWAIEACGLRKFSRDSCSAWAEIIRQMIRTEMPDFHLRPEWKNQRHNAQERGLNQRGEMQNAILDDICEALRTIAPWNGPPNRLPEFKARNKAGCMPRDLM